MMDLQNCGFIVPTSFTFRTSRLYKPAFLQRISFHYIFPASPSIFYTYPKLIRATPATRFLICTSHHHRSTNNAWFLFTIRNPITFYTAKNSTLILFNLKRPFIDWFTTDNTFSIRISSIAFGHGSATIPYQGDFVSGLFRQHLSLWVCMLIQGLTNIFHSLFSTF